MTFSLFIESFNKLVDSYTAKANDEMYIQNLSKFYILPIDRPLMETPTDIGFKEFLTGFRLFPQLMGFYFLTHIQQAGNYLLFASYEADYLGIDCKSKTVNLIGYEEIEEDKEITNTYPTAMNIEVFLECLLVIAELRFKRLLKITSIKDKAENRRYAAMCIEKAGGDHYQTLWMSICSAWS